MANSFPKVHNAMWPGLVGKDPGTENPPIGIETMLEYTEKAKVDGATFDGVDIFLFDPHFNIDASNDEIKALADNVQSRGLKIGSVVAPVWPPTDGGSAADEGEGRQKFLTQVRKAARIAQKLRDLDARPYGVIRMDSATDVETWAKDPEGNQKRIAQTFQQAADIAKDHGERLAAEGEICWGGMHSCRRMVELLEMTDRPNTVGFQADLAHTLLYLLGYNAPEDRILPEDFDWSDTRTFDDAYKQMTDALRPWTIDFHVAQNDATVFGSGSHDKTGRHCMPKDPNGKLDVAKYSGYWLKGAKDRGIHHICWDGCMFPNDTMARKETWDEILEAMVNVREAHGWGE